MTIRFVVDEYMKNWQEIYDWIIGLSPSASLEQRAEYLEKNEKFLEKNPTPIFCAGPIRVV